MARRRTVFTNGEVYHIFNHSIAGIPIFSGEVECKLFLESMKFYSQPNPPVKFSIYRQSRNSFPLQLDEKIVTIINYCFMPNHFHLTLRQDQDGGIKQFIQRISNSFAHYFSIKNQRRGHIFEDRFKSVHVETDEQLLHLSRYVHLNPVTAYLVENPEDYPFSSYNIYTGKEASDLVDNSLIMSRFTRPEEYRQFVMAQKDYQRSLNKIYHLLLE